jgi:ketosteroid isomerase-like protein
MNQGLRRVAPLAALLASALLASTTTLAAMDSDRIRLETAMHRWLTAVNARDEAALTATMTEDVELLDANASTVTGRNAAIRTLREIVTRGQLAATSREITITHDVAWRVVALVQTQKNGDVHARGQALEIWKRVKGEWKLHRQMAAGVIAPSDSLTRPTISEPVLDRPRN